LYEGEIPQITSCLARIIVDSRSMNSVPAKILLSMSVLTSPLLAQDELPSPTEVLVQKNDHYDKVVALPIQNMKTPKFWEGKKLGIGEMNVPVSTNDPLVQKHVRQGFLLLHAQWDIEAYRHFSAALKREPDCLMAYCGVVLSLIHPEHEWKAHRASAINRMLTLAEHKAGETFSFPENERDYALAIGSLVVNGLAGGAAAFESLSEKYENDIQLSLIAPFLNRGGYDSFGNASPQQRKALKAVKAVLDKNPTNVLVTNFYVMMQVEAPSNALDVKTVVLPYAKKLVEDGGADFPGWQMNLGFAAWRSGEMELARDAFKKAVSLYETWKAESGAHISECDALIRAYAFLAVVHYQMGEAKLSDAVLVKLDQAKKARKTSAVSIYHRWRYDMIKVNMLLAEAATGDKLAIKKMLKQLPKVNPKDTANVAKNKLIKAYQAYGLARDYFYSGKEEDSTEMNNLLAKTGEELTRLESDHRGKPYYGHYLVLLQSLKVYRAEFLAEISGEDGAYGFYQEAIDEQIRPNRYFPPSVLYPLEYKLGQIFEKRGDLPQAREAYTKAYKRMPSHKPTREAYEKFEAIY